MKERILVIETVTQLQEVMKAHRENGKKIGFTPTLGALHSGHASLISRSIRENDISICSIFVNPTQFNEKTDLKKYPRTFKADKKLLNATGCDILFFPSIKEIYPKGTKHSVKVKLDGLDKKLEGAFRPGHFDGVVQVVHRLLDIVKPDRLYMGQKDFQQFTIIQKMIKALKMSEELIVCDIMREKDGLAMSSRNRRLTKKNRNLAPLIHKTLLEIKKKYKAATPQELCKYAMIKMDIEGFKPEYFQIIDGYTLDLVKDFKKSKYCVAVTAVWAGDIRLIDNMILYST